MSKVFNPMEHELVPEHILLTKEEAEELLKHLKIRKRQLPWIRASDPIARKLGARPGDVILIIRRSPTAGKSVYLRVVVHG